MPAEPNPLFACEEPPRFGAIETAAIVASIRELIARQNAGLETIEREAEQTWAGLMDPLTRLSEPLTYAWNLVHHLLSVQNSPDLRTVNESVQGEVVAASMRLSQSEPIYRGMKQLMASAEWSRLEQAQQRIVEANVQAMELSGIGLQDRERERFNEVAKELAELGTKFENNLLDATKAFALVLTRPEEIDGLPSTLLAMAAQAARSNNIDKDATAQRGPWRISLEGPMFVPFMEHSRRADLREQLYRAFITRASSEKTDNQPVIERILALRREQARLLGYTSFAETSVKRKMARDVPSVEKLLDELRLAAKPRAKEELAELEAFARAETGDQQLTLKHWDMAFWSERMRERKFSISDEQLRPYFPLPRVLDGLFALAKKVFNISVTPIDGEVPVWHKDVRYFAISDERGARIASFYLDPYSRPENKRGGAWMNNCLDRKRSGNSLRLPIAYLVCNQSPPADGKPSLMTFREVETLFHEFGHGLQHMLTTVDYSDAAGINNVEWDAVELPSQFMENWCYHRDTLLGLAKHWQTNEPLPEDIFNRLRAARTFRSASAILRQVNLSTLDIELHHRFDPSGKESVWSFSRAIAAENSIIPPLPEDRFLCSFSHIFPGGYAAGYYSYKWAEVLSADAFGAFEEAGLDDPAAVAKTGARFRSTVLALGGSKHPMDVFKAFRGRPPTTEALLKQHGLMGQSQR
jgi:oligopeptidase A